MNSDQLLDQCVWEIEDFLYRMIKRKVTVLLSVRAEKFSLGELSVWPINAAEREIRTAIKEEFETLYNEQRPII